MKLAKKRTACLAAAAAEGFSVDPQSGAMRNVALLTVGPTVDLRFYMDEVTIQTAHAAIAKRGGKLRIYPTHSHAGMPHSWKERSCDDADSELNYAAFAAEITANKKQLVGGKLEFYDAFRNNYRPQFDQIVECAAKTPDLIGLSLEPIFHLVYVGKDGVEYNAWPEKVDLAYDGLPAMRIDDIFTAAFGSVVAANAGLFATLSAKFGGKRMAKLAKQIAAELRGAVGPGGDHTSAADLAAKPTIAANAVQSSAHNTGQPISPDLRTMKLIADLKAKFTDPTRFAAAMSIVGNTPADKLAGLSVGEVEQQLIVVDLTAATGQVSKLTADLTAANGQVSKLTADLATMTLERDTLKTQLETAKKSGLPGAVDLGATSAGGAAPQENPFLTDNLTAQARLTKTDPARAETLKQAAAAAKSAQKK